MYISHCNIKLFVLRRVGFSKNVTQVSAYALWKLSQTLLGKDVIKIC